MTSVPADFRARGFFLSDHAAVENGKVYVNGGFWNRLTYPAFPAVATFAVVAVLEVPWRAYHQSHRFAVRFEDADGHPHPGRFEGEFMIGPPPDAKIGDPALLPFAGTINNFLIERPGDFAAVFEVDGTEMDRWPFRAVQHFAASAAGQPPEGGPPPGAGPPTD